MGIFDFLKGSGIKTTSFDELRKKVVNLRSSNLNYYVENLPQAISFPFDFWDDLIGIYRKTYSDGLERAFSVFWADGEIVFTEVNTGSDRMVKSGGTIQVKYSQHPTKQGYARKELFIDGKVVKKKDVYRTNIPKALEVQYMFNVHTHPKHTNDTGGIYYNFFSAQDVKSLIESKAIVTGLITDKLWLLIRTSQTPEDVSTLTDSMVTEQYLEEQLHIGLYRADFSKKAYRYKYVKDL